MCLTFASFERCARVSQKRERKKKRVLDYLRPRFAESVSRPVDRPALSEIALDFDLASDCFQTFDFIDAEQLVDRYIEDLQTECRALGKRGLDESAEARSGVVVAGVPLCRRDFERPISRSRFSWSTTSRC